MAPSLRSALQLGVVGDHTAVVGLARE